MVWHYKLRVLSNQDPLYRIMVNLKREYFTGDLWTLRKRMRTKGVEMLEGPLPGTENMEKSRLGEGQRWSLGGQESRQNMPLCCSSGRSFTKCRRKVFPTAFGTLYHVAQLLQLTSCLLPFRAVAPAWLCQEHTSTPGLLPLPLPNPGILSPVAHWFPLFRIYSNVSISKGPFLSTTNE